MRKGQGGNASIGAVAALAAIAAIAGGGATAGAQTPPPQGQPQVTCQTIGGTTYCQDGTRFDQTQASSPSAAAAADGRPARQSIGGSGPTQYQRDDLRIFGVDDRLRRLGEKNQNPTGQQGGPSTYSGRNCGAFTTSVICD
jgi:hypothetical protein